jgi:hypothetical protein
VSFPFAASVLLKQPERDPRAQHERHVIDGKLEVGVLMVGAAQSPGMRRSIWARYFLGVAPL